MAEHSPSGEIVLSSLLDYVGRRESDVVRGVRLEYQNFSSRMHASRKLNVRRSCSLA
jgi:hypothetical protein